MVSCQQRHVKQTVRDIESYSLVQWARIAQTQTSKATCSEGSWPISERGDFGAIGQDPSVHFLDVLRYIPQIPLTGLEICQSLELEPVVFQTKLVYL